MEILKNPDFNPMPPEPTAGFTTTDDGVRLRYAFWRTKKPCKGTVLLLHGRAEYIEKLYETISDIRANGYDVLSFDWRGQGGSDRLLNDPRRGFVEHFSQYTTDLDAIFKNVALPDCRAPYFILAHSTGALVSMLAAPVMGNRVRRMVLCAPLLGLKSAPLPITLLKFYSGTMHVLGLGGRYASGGANPDQERVFKGNKLTSDFDRFQRNKRMAVEFPELTIGSPTLSWVFAAIRAMETVRDPDFYASINIPMLMICGANDKVVDNGVAEMISRRVRSGSSVMITGAKHELMHERDRAREQLLAAFYAFVPGSTAQKSESRSSRSAGAGAIAGPPSPVPPAQAAE